MNVTLITTRYSDTRVCAKYSNCDTIPAADNMQESMDVCNPCRRLNYQGKMIMAPMVKIGTTPARLVALDYGADIVYTEEIIDWRLLRSTRIENPVLNTVDYIDR